MINVPTRDEWDQLLICQEFAGYQKLVCSMDEHVGQKHQELRRELDNIAARLTDAEERDAFNDYRVEEYLELEHSKRILMHSLFVASVSLFEFRFFHICERAKRLSRNPIGVTDLGQFSMQKAKLYLDRLGVEVPAASAEWRDANIFQQIRNRIVHQGGFVDPTSNVADYARNHRIALDLQAHLPTVGNSVQQPLQLELTQSFCRGAFDTLAELLIQVSKACNKRRWEDYPT